MQRAVVRQRLRRGLRDCCAVALAELRSIRRLTRSWVFLALGLWVFGSAFVYYSTRHAAISGANPDAGNLLPRFTIPYFGSYVLWFFMAALVFLAFDLGSRDERERIAEVVDSRPLSNVALLGGRLAAVAVTLLVPLFAIVLTVQAVGTIGASLGWPIHPLEGVVAFAFLLVDAVPAVTLWGAIVVLLAVAVRNRLIVAIAALALLGVHVWSVGQVPSYLLPVVSLLYVHDNWASDLAPRFPRCGRLAAPHRHAAARGRLFIVGVRALPARGRGLAPDTTASGRRPSCAWSCRFGGCPAALDWRHAASGVVVGGAPVGR